MRALENCSIEFPSTNRAAIHSKVHGKLPLAPAHQSALLPKPLRNRPSCWQRVVAEKLDDAVQRGRLRGLEFAPFPVDDGELRDFQNARYGFLCKSEQEPAFADMVPNGLGLEISFLWFQGLKSNRRKLQKSNASLQLRLLGALQRPLSLHAGSDRPLSRQALRAVARPHRYPDRRACGAAGGINAASRGRELEGGEQPRGGGTAVAARAPGEAQRPALAEGNRKTLCARTAGRSTA